MPALSDMELRAFDGTEIRVVEEPGQTPKIVGLAVPYGKESRVMLDKDTGEKFIEIVEPGAAARILATKAEITCDVNHVGGLSVLGSTRTNTLRCWDAPEGVRFECEPPPTSVGKDAVILAKRGEFRCSFGFLPAKGAEKWSRGDDGVARRSISDFRRFRNVCLTDTPAYPDTACAVRSLKEWEAEQAKPPAQPAPPTDDGEIERLRLRLDLESRFNPNHDEKGLFSAGEGGVGEALDKPQGNEHADLVGPDHGFFEPIRRNKMAEAEALVKKYETKVGIGSAERQQLNREIVDVAKKSKDSLWEKDTEFWRKNIGTPPQELLRQEMHGGQTAAKMTDIAKRGAELKAKEEALHILESRFNPNHDEKGLFASGAGGGGGSSDADAKSATAHAASKKATESGQAYDHHAAIDAHHTAAAAHMAAAHEALNAGDIESAKSHMASADVHTSAIVAHTKGAMKEH